MVREGCLFGFRRGLRAGSGEGARSAWGAT